MEDAPDVSLFGSEAGRRALSLANQSREISETRKLMGLMVPPADPQNEQLRLQNAELTRQLAEIRNAAQIDGLKRDFDAKFERIAVGLAAMSTKEDGNRPALQDVLLGKLIDRVIGQPVDPLASAASVVKVARDLAGIGSIENEFAVRGEELRLKEKWGEARLAIEERERLERLRAAGEQEARRQVTEDRVIQLGQAAFDTVLKPIGASIAGSVGPALARKIDSGGPATAPTPPPPLTPEQREAALRELDRTQAEIERMREMIVGQGTSSPPIGQNPAPPAQISEPAPTLIPYYGPQVGRVYGPGQNPDGEQS